MMRSPSQCPGVRCSLTSAGRWASRVMGVAGAAAPGCVPTRADSGRRAAVAFDLPVDRLVALADRRRDLLDAASGVEPVGDSGPVILGQESGRDRSWVGYEHRASAEEPQRSAAG